jgi:alkanesulfonate monooxygenase
MPVEFIGYVGTQEVSEIIPPSGPVIDTSYTRRVALAHEAGGFDRVLMAHSSASPDAVVTATQVFADTNRLGVLLAHRPGFVAPTLMARTLATLDHFSKGRIAVHIISGGDDADQRRDGDFLDHDQRYARTAEYLDIIKRIWGSDAPIDHEGTNYRFAQAYSSVKPLQQPHLPIYFGGSSEAAIKVAARFADVYALWGESLAQVSDTIARVRTAAAAYGRAEHIRFSLSLRPILGRTEADAWARADEILAKAKALQGNVSGDNGAGALRLFEKRKSPPANVGSQRLLETASQGKVVDKRLWTEIAALTGAKGNSTSLVGTPDQVVESLLAYYELGVTTFLIRGFNPLLDSIEYGHEIIPRVRAEIAHRESRDRPPLDRHVKTAKAG